MELVESKGYIIVDEAFLEEMYQTLKFGDVEICKGTQGGFKYMKFPIDGRFYSFCNDTGKMLKMI